MNNNYDIDIGVLRYLPGELHYLIDPAMRYGKYQFSEDIDRFIDNADDELLEQLQQIRRRYDDFGHDKILDVWMRKYRMTEYEEVARLYFLFSVIG